MAPALQQRWRRSLPLAMAGLLLALGLGLGSVRVRSESGVALRFTLAALAAYLVWLLIETLLVSVREASLPSSREDRGSCETYAAAQGLTVVLALLFPAAFASALAPGAGLAAMAVGFGLRLGAIVTLGRFYSRRVRLVDGHQVVTGGPYRLVRHPAYLGTLLGHLGLSLALGGWPSLAAWALLFVPLVVRRILVEEPLLFGLDGYAQYARTHKRLVPLLW